MMFRSLGVTALKANPESEYNLAKTNFAQLWESEF